MTSKIPETESAQSCPEGHYYASRNTHAKIPWVRVCVTCGAIDGSDLDREFDEATATALEAAKREARKDEATIILESLEETLLNGTVEDGLSHVREMQQRIAQLSHPNQPEQPKYPDGYSPTALCEYCDHYWTWHVDNGWCYAQRYGTGHCPCYEFVSATNQPKQEGGGDGK